MIAPSIQVTLQDADGSPATGSSAIVTVAVASGTGVAGATLTGTLSRSTSVGIATFGDLGLDKAGAYTLTVSAPGLTGANTNSFAVVAGAPATMTVQLGNNQSGTVGAAIPIPPAVVVTDALGNVKAGVAVVFAVASGGGSLTGATPTTDASGVATVGSWTMGPSGANTLTATVAGGGITGNPVTFSAAAAVLLITAVLPDTLVEGASAVITGTGFSPSLASNTVMIDGAAATVVAASGTQLTVTVPPYDCRPGRDGDIRVTVGGVNSNAATHRLHPASFVNLAVGAQQIVQAPAGFCLQFRPSSAGGDGYLIGVGAAAELPSTLFPVTISSGTGASAGAGLAAAVRPPPRSPAPVSARVQTATEVEVERLWRSQLRAEARIRDWERERLPELVRQTRTAALAARPMTPVAVVPIVGDTVRVRVPNWALNGCSDYSEVISTVRAVGTKGIWVRDPANPGPDSLTDAEIQSYSDLFDTMIYPGTTDYFGAPSDVDGNQRVLIVLSIAVNRIPFGIAGFVSFGDLFPRGAPCASSNFGEVYYSHVPDPGNTAGTGARSHAAVADQMPSLIAHEFTHVIQGSRRVVLAPGTHMASWELEGQAMLAQEVVGHLALGNSAGQNYPLATVLSGAGWYANGFVLLAGYFGFNGSTGGRNANAPEQCSLYANLSIILACDPAAFYGASWVFQRYLTDRFGPSYPGGGAALNRDVIGKNVNLAGRANWENLLGLTAAGYDSVYAQWAAMLYVDGQVAAVSAAQQMSSWDLFSVMNGIGSPNALLLPAARTFTAFSDARSVRGGGTAYTTLTSAGARPALAVKVRDGGGGVIGAAMRAQVWVTRIQ